MEAELGSNPSQIWRAILDGRGALAQGVIRRIGTGETTRVWEDNWLPRSGMMKWMLSLVVDKPVWV